MQERFVGRIMQGMDVCDNNGDKLGTVAHVYRYDPMVVGMSGDAQRLPHDELIELKTGFLGLGKHLFVPMGVVEEVTQSCVFLSRAADEVKHNDEWQYKPSYLDELH